MATGGFDTEAAHIQMPTRRRLAYCGPKMVLTKGSTLDILQRRPGNRWRLIEVKSSVDVKEYHLYDVAIQAHVLRGCGLDLSSSCLMHLNRDYVYDGLHYDPKELFAIRNLTRQIRKLDPEVPKLLKAERKVLALEHPPDIAPGRQCSEPVPASSLVAAIRRYQNTTFRSCRGSAERNR
jgi:hypothetical protein